MRDMFKDLKTLGKVAKDSGAFLGGIAFGTLGLKVLCSDDAKKKYAKVIAKSYLAKDKIGDALSQTKQHADDVLADAADIYEAEKKKEADKAFDSSEE